MSLVATTRKLGLSFFEYVGERICETGIILFVAKHKKVSKKSCDRSFFGNLKKYLGKQ